MAKVLPLPQNVKMGVSSVTKFATYSDYYNELLRIQSIRPDIVTVGISSEKTLAGNYDIPYITVGDTTKPAFMMIASTHSLDEWQTSHLILNFIEKILNPNDNQNSFNTQLLQHYCFISVPIVNVWGYFSSINGAHHNGHSYTHPRANEITWHDNTNYAHFFGTNLARNYDYGWDEFLDIPFSAGPNANTDQRWTPPGSDNRGVYQANGSYNYHNYWAMPYVMINGVKTLDMTGGYGQYNNHILEPHPGIYDGKGAYPFSEPETRLVRDLVLQHNTVGFCDWHDMAGANSPSRSVTYISKNEPTGNALITLTEQALVLVNNRNPLIVEKMPVPYNWIMEDYSKPMSVCWAQNVAGAKSFIWETTFGLESDGMTNTDLWTDAYFEMFYRAMYWAQVEVEPIQVSKPTLSLQGTVLTAVSPITGTTKTPQFEYITEGQPYANMLPATNQGSSNWQATMTVQQNELQHTVTCRAYVLDDAGNKIYSEPATLIVKSLSRIAISCPSAGMAPNTSQQYSALGYTAQNESFKVAVDWSVIDTTIATINSAGLLTSKNKTGNTTVKAKNTLTNIEATATIQVSEVTFGTIYLSLTGKTLSIASQILLLEGDSLAYQWREGLGQWNNFPQAVNGGSNNWVANINTDMLPAIITARGQVYRAGAPYNSLETAPFTVREAIKFINPVQLSDISAFGIQSFGSFGFGQYDAYPFGHVFETVTETNPNELIIFDEAGKEVAIIDNVIECFIIEALNGEETLEFYLPITDPKWDDIKEERRIRIEGKEYVILSIGDKRDERGLLQSNVQAIINAHWELDKVKNQTLELDTMTGLGGLEVILDGTGWAVGQVDSAKYRSLANEMKSVLFDVREWNTKHNGYILFDSKNHTVSMVDNPGVDMGIQVVLGKNLLSIERNIDMKEFATRMFPIGDQDLDISMAHPDGLTYIDNFSYYIDQGYSLQHIKDDIAAKGKASKFLHETEWKANDYVDAQSLFEDAQAKLASICIPRVGYVVKMIDLSNQTGYEHEKFKLGDTLTAIDDDLKINTKQRIVKRKHYPFEPHRDEAEFANRSMSLADSAIHTARAVNDYNRYGDVWTQGSKTVLNNQGTWDKAAILGVDSIPAQLLKGMVSAAKATFQGGTNNSVTLTENGLEVADHQVIESQGVAGGFGQFGFGEQGFGEAVHITDVKWEKVKIIRLNNGAIGISKDGGKTWVTALTTDGWYIVDQGGVSITPNEGFIAQHADGGYTQVSSDGFLLFEPVDVTTTVAFENLINTAVIYVVNGVDLIPGPAKLEELAVVIQSVVFNQFANAWQVTLESILSQVFDEGITFTQKLAVGRKYYQMTHTGTGTILENDDRLLDPPDVTIVLPARFKGKDFDVDVAVFSITGGVGVIAYAYAYAVSYDKAAGTFTVSGQVGSFYPPDWSTYYKWGLSFTYVATA